MALLMYIYKHNDIINRIKVSATLKDTRGRQDSKCRGSWDHGKNGLPG
jgi:hypothetical protein